MQLNIYIISYTNYIEGQYLKTNVLVYFSGLIFFRARINSEWYIKEIWGPIFQL